jgi:hypothetical protein
MRDVWEGSVVDIGAMQRSISSPSAARASMTGEVSRKYP